MISLNSLFVGSLKTNSAHCPLSNVTIAVAASSLFSIFGQIKLRFALADAELLYGA